MFPKKVFIGVLLFLPFGVIAQHNPVVSDLKGFVQPGLYANLLAAALKEPVNTKKQNPNLSRLNTYIAVVAPPRLNTTGTAATIARHTTKGTKSEDNPATQPNTTAARTITCNNWLSTFQDGDYATIGDLDITGNQLTVEALFNRTEALNSGLYPGHLVSKHSDNSNYSLFPNGCALNTSNGYFEAFENCPIQLNKTYHVAMVYNGTTLRYYRNGFLHSQVACTGALVNNDLMATIGQVAGGVPASINQFKGVINEVRIWKKARTQAELNSTMNIALPNPNTQPDLVGYYVFSTLANNQGNAAFNATLWGGTVSNASNPNCVLIADSCSSPNTTTIINKYTAVTGQNPCNNSITVENSTDFGPGDTVAIIQMKGAIVDTSNTASFGTVTDYRGAGRCLFNIIESRNGTTLILKNLNFFNFDVADGRVQLVRVPYYSSLTVTGTYTCPPWNGKTGGVLILNAKDTITLQGSLDVSGKGFRGGSISNNPDGACGSGSTGYYYPLTQPGGAWSTGGAEKGEGIAEVSEAKRAGRGRLANGGGGGNKHNTGGGGGSNFSTGGKGGNELGGCLVLGTGGIGGADIRFTTGAPFYMGGGGGCGDINNNVGTTGANGGGIVIVMSKHLNGNDNRILANGNSQLIPGTGIADGAGGGGGGGTIVMSVNSYTGPTHFEAKGGKGGNQDPFFGCVGPGGGGGGGVVYFTTSLSAVIQNTINTIGGSAGTFTATNFTCSNSTYGATAGGNGDTLQNLILSVANTPFRKNVDSLRIRFNSQNCSSITFDGFAYVNTSPITNWQWNFGDGNTASGESVTHTYASSANYTVTLTVTDSNGCVDSTSVIVNSTGISANAGADTSVCGNPAIVGLRGNGGVIYAWSPAAVLNDSTLQNPTATLTGTTTFILTTYNATRTCLARDTITVTVNRIDSVRIRDSAITCTQRSFRGLAFAGSSAISQWSWQFGDGSTASTQNATHQYLTNGNFTVTLKVVAQNGCTDSSSRIVAIENIIASAAPDTSLCGSSATIPLRGNGGSSYTWSPAAVLNDANLQNPIATVTSTTAFVLKAYNSDRSCFATDTITLRLISLTTLRTPPNATGCTGTPIQLNGNNGNDYRYDWSPAAGLSNPAIETPVWTGGPTAYTVTISNASCNIQQVFLVQVVATPPPLLRLTSTNDINCTFPATTLSAAGAAQYTWTPNATLSSGTGSTVIATPTATTTYVVTGTSTGGCTAKDSIIINVSNAGKAFSELPNSFTPNNDGRNDCFGIGRFWNGIQSIEFSIFNRYGQPVFVTTQPGKCWDGTFKGVSADPGSYVYFIKAKSLCGVIEKKGTVLLIR
jgi:gliding motility-associated-like protein